MTINFIVIYIKYQRKKNVSGFRGDGSGRCPQSSA